VVAAGAVIGGLTTGVITLGSVNLVYQLYKQIPKQRTLARLRVKDTVLRVSQGMIDGVTLIAGLDGRIEMRVRHKPVSSAAWLQNAKPEVVLSGDEALAAARQLLPQINRAGGTPAEVSGAVSVLENTPDTGTLFDRYAKIAGSRRSAFTGIPSAGEADRDVPLALSSLRAPVRLALEMSLHEDDERRALEGELAELEDRWREAEEVAAISDDMFLPASVDAILKRLKSSKPKDG
jgi:hypothetical protein